MKLHMTVKWKCREKRTDEAYVTEKMEGEIDVDWAKYSDKKKNANGIVQSTATTIIECDTHSNWLFIICLIFIEMYHSTEQHYNSR